jgi:hypothetical protein
MAEVDRMLDSACLRTALFANDREAYESNASAPTPSTANSSVNARRDPGIVKRSAAPLTATSKADPVPTVIGEQVCSSTHPGGGCLPTHAERRETAVWGSPIRNPGTANAKKRYALPDNPNVQLVSVPQQHEALDTIWVPTQVDSGLHTVHGYAQLEARGTARVVAYGKATVMATGEAEVWANDSTTVIAAGCARVYAHRLAEVRASERAHVRAHGQAHVRASGETSVLAYDNAQITATDSVRVVAHGHATASVYGNAQVTAYDQASVWAGGAARVMAADATSVDASGESEICASGAAVVNATDHARITAKDVTRISAHNNVRIEATPSVQIRHHGRDTEIIRLAAAQGPA